MKATHPARGWIEILEQRIAPAAVFIYTDADGDEVTVSTSKGTNADLAAVATTASGILQKLNLSAKSVFRGTDLTISVTNVAGDGIANVGHINARGMDLGAVKISGDVGQIDAGNRTSSTAGIATLEIGSLGKLGLTTQSAGGSLESTVVGKIGTLDIDGSLHGVLRVTGGANGQIDNLTIGDSIVGGATAFSGSIRASGAIGSVVIANDIVGGTGKNSGFLQSGKNIASVKVGDDVIGGTSATASQSGLITARGRIELVEITGTLQGGSGTQSGAVGSGKGLGTIVVKEGIVGGSGLESGTIGSLSSITQVTVSANPATSLAIEGGTGVRSGAILSKGDIGTVTLNGSLRGGTTSLSGAIAASKTLGTVTVNGNVEGGDGSQSGSIGSLRALGNVLVTGNLSGGFGDFSGRIVSATSIAKVEVQQSVFGSFGRESGTIGSLGTLNSVVIGGDVIGGFELRAGAILSGLDLPDVEVGGSVLGSTGNESGSIIARRNIGTVEIAGNLGFSGGERVLFELGAAAVSTMGDSGRIFAGRLIDSVEIGGSLIGGDDLRTGTIASNGGINFVSIQFDVVGGFGDFSGSITSKGAIGTIEVLGSLFGGSGLSSGSIETSGRGAAGDIDDVFIGGNIQGSSGENSGRIYSSGTLSALLVGTAIPPEGEGEVFIPGFGGTVNGGFAPGAGSIESKGDMGSITLLSNLARGTDVRTGSITSGGTIGSIEIGGNLDGFSSFAEFDLSPRVQARATIVPTAQIYANGAIGPVHIGGEVLGGSADYSGTVSGASIGDVEVDGSVRAGTGSYTASFLARSGDIESVDIAGTLSAFTFSESTAGFHSASISASRFLGPVSLGSAQGSSDARIYITAGGVVGARGENALAIASITTQNGIINTDVLAGYNLALVAVNPDVQIGNITIGTTGENTGDWIATNVVAGAVHGADGIFGTEDDRLISARGASAATISTIGSIVIEDEVLGIAEGIVAQHVQAITVGGLAEPQLTAGALNDTPFLLTADSDGGTSVYELIRVPSFRV